MAVEFYGGNDSGAKVIADDLDGKINPDIPTSEVAMFNAMGKGEIEVSKYVYDLVALSFEVYEKSNGAFDITLSALSKHWRVDSDSLSNYGQAEFPSLPSFESLDGFASGMSAISIREEDGKYYLSKAEDFVSIDLGGIAKGYLSDLVCEKLKANSVKSAIIDVSGNLYLLGKKHTEDGSLLDWKIGVTNCFDNGGEYLCGIVIPQSTAVVTSGTYERCYQKDGVKINHIINPHTKMPVGVTYENGYINTSDYLTSVTVVGGNGALCDAVATAVCVLGMEQGKNLVSEFGLSALLVSADGKYSTVGDIDFMDFTDGNFYIETLERI